MNATSNSTATADTTDLDLEVTARTIYLPTSEPIIFKNGAHVVRGCRRLGRFATFADAWAAWAAMDAERDFEPVTPVAI